MTINPDVIVNANNPDSPQFLTAKIAEIHDDEKPYGVTLIFPGESETNGKIYKVVNGAPLIPGHRVLVLNDSGTHIVVGSIAEKPPAWVYNNTLLSSTATLEDVILKLNNLITRLAGYGYFVLK